VGYPEVKDISEGEMQHYFFNESLCCWDGGQIIDWLEQIGDAIG
jgi:hypothetical protein